MRIVLREIQAEQPIMATTSRPVDPEVLAILDDLEHLRDRPLAWINDSGVRLAALIPVEECDAARAEMVGWLDEVAARKPSRPPGPALKIRH